MQKRPEQRLTRRDFLKNAASASVVGVSGVCIACKEGGKGKAPSPAEKGADAKTAKQTTSPRPSRSKVVLVRSDEVLDAKGEVDAAVIERMLDEGVQALLGEPDPKKAWARLVKADDTVGIKSNVWRFLPTPPALEQALRARVRAAGVSAERIAVDDRRVLDNPVFQRATALINVRTLRTHHWSGIGSCIKNYIMFSPQPSQWHDDACANLAGLWQLPLVKGKTRLNIQVMLTPLFHGKGPHHYQAEYTWPYKGLILGLDPVAVDATALRVLSAKRKAFFGKDQPFAVSPKHVRVAQDKYQLGWAHAEKIELVRLGPAEGALI